MAASIERLRINESDMYLCPDLDTWTVFPWEMKMEVLQFWSVMSIQAEGANRFAGDPRGNLKRALRHMEEVGLNPSTLVEPEFFLFKLDNGDQHLK